MSKLVRILCCFVIAILSINLRDAQDVSAQAGNVVIKGQVTYQPRNWNPQSPRWRFGEELIIKLYHKDLQGRNNYLGMTTTDRTGKFTFPSRINWWAPDNRKLNIFYVIVTAYPNEALPVTSVTDTLFGQYTFQSQTTYLAVDGEVIYNFQVNQGYPGYEALWIYGDLRRAWNYVYDEDIRNGVNYNPGKVKGVWEKGRNCFWHEVLQELLCSSFAYGGPLDKYFFLSDKDNVSADVVAHETGHIFMVNANGHWYVDKGCFNHYINKISDQNCAWAEGWADFFPLAVNGDRCYDYTAKPCDPSGTEGIDYFDLEAHNKYDRIDVFNWGDKVEGRIAGTLNDLYDFDNPNELYDKEFSTFGPISQIALGKQKIVDLKGFRNSWRINEPEDLQFEAGLIFWWNTINYDNIQQVFLPCLSR